MARTTIPARFVVRMVVALLIWFLTVVGFMAMWALFMETGHPAEMAVSGIIFGGVVGLILALGYLFGGGPAKRWLRRLLGLLLELGS